MFATGTSCAVDLGFGMPALEEHLKSVFEVSGALNNEQLIEWESVLEVLKKNNDFEAAMNNVANPQLLGKIIDETASFVGATQERNIVSILTSPDIWTASQIIQRLVAKLPHTDPTLHMATPNYDLLAEIAMSALRIPYTTGFLGGVIRQLNWTQALRQMTYLEQFTHRGQPKKKSCFMNHVKLYKVHGSLNVFSKDRDIVECDLWQKPPEGYERLMITPGTSKHEKLHNYRDTLLSEFDNAVRKHNKFLFLGFGFNDTQLVNNAITDKLTKEGAQGLIITRDVNPRIEELLENSPTTWLVCKSDVDDSTRIYNREYNHWLYLKDIEIWRFEKFAIEIMGH